MGGDSNLVAVKIHYLLLFREFHSELSKTTNTLWDWKHRVESEGESYKMLKYFTNDQNICYQSQICQVNLSFPSIFLAMEAVQGHNRYCLVLSCSYYNIRDTRVLEMKQKYSV